MAATETPTPVEWSSFGYVRVAAVAPVVRIADPLGNAAEIAAWATRAAGDHASLVVFPELALTGYTCEDLFLTDDLRLRTEAGLVELCRATAALPATFVVGTPLHTADGRRYNAAVVIAAGRVHGAVPKQHLPNAGEFYERRWFTPGTGVDTMVSVPGLEPFRLHARQLFRAEPLVFGIEVCEDLWAPEPPSGGLAVAGAVLVANPSASNELVAKADYRRDLVRQQSARTITSYVYAGSGPTESTKDVVFGGHLMVAENGALLAEGERFALAGSMTAADIDVERLRNERARNITWSTAATVTMPVVELPRAARLPALRRAIDRQPFVPNDPATVDARAAEIIAIQSTGLARRLLAAQSDRAVIGVSGGLDSTLALLVAVEAMHRLGRSADRILGITMPGPGTTARTRTAADDLMARLGIEARTITIGASVAQHFEDIGHKPDDHSIVFENAQARERTQILFDVANQVGGIVVGTGDLSELALGWCTYNADHMSNYGVNASVPKTLVRHLVRWYARTSVDDATRDVLLDIADTPVSPELLPPDADGNITQHTEDVIGPYELHDFFLWHTLRNGFAPEKIRALARIAFADSFDQSTIDRWLRMFLERFHRQQFKRTTLPPGPKVGSVSVSPRGDLRMPDEVDAAAITAFLDGPPAQANPPVIPVALVRVPGIRFNDGLCRPFGADVAHAYPTHPDQLTAAWLTSALRASGAITTSSVVDLSTTPVGEGVGMLGILCRVFLTYDTPEASAPATLIAKFPTPIEGNRIVAMTYRLYERESGFYRLIAPTITAAAPRCYTSEIEPVSGDSVLLLEDLGEYRMGDQVEGCTAAQAVEVIDAVAPLHAKFWGHPETLPLDCVPRIDSESQSAGISGGCQVGWDPCVERFGHVMAPEILAVRDRFIAAVPALHTMMGQRTQTVIHGDVRLDNLMFGVRAGQEPVVLLDWALTISTGLQDVAYLLSQNVTTEERRSHEKELLEHYHSVVTGLGADLTLDQAWQDYRVAVLYLLCYAIVIAGTLDPSNERGALFMEKLLERSSNAVMDLGVLDLLPA